MTFTPVGESIISLGDYESSRNEYSLHWKNSRVWQGYREHNLQHA